MHEERAHELACIPLDRSPRLKSQAVHVTSIELAEKISQRPIGNDFLSNLQLIFLSKKESINPIIFFFIRYYVSQRAIKPNHKHKQFLIIAKIQITRIINDKLFTRSESRRERFFVVKRRH